MKLYSGPLSLYARKVEIALGEKGLVVERIMVPFTQTRGYQPKHPDVSKANPKGQVPVLQDGNLVLTDSTVILEYLEEAFPEPALYPREPRAKGECRQLELFADEVMIVPLRALMHRTEPHEDGDPRWLAAEANTGEAGEVLARYFADLDRRLASRAFVCDRLSVADIALFMQVHYSRRLAGPPVRVFPDLWRWYEHLAARPAFRTVVEEIRQADLELSAAVPGAYG